MVDMQIATLDHFLEVKPSTGEFNEKIFKLKFSEASKIKL